MWIIISKFPLGQGDFGDDSPKVPASEITITIDYDFIFIPKMNKTKKWNTTTMAKVVAMPSNVGQGG
jgi:hypothetical protein